MAKRRIDTLLAERGLFETRSRAAAAVLAGDVRLRDGRRAEKPGQLVAGRRAARGRRGPALRLARRAQARERACARFGVDPAGRRCLDVGRLDGRVHRLPAAARRRGGRRARRGLRRAALAAAPGSARDRDRAHQRALARARRAALRARPDRRRRVVHLAHQGAAGGVRLRRADASTASRWSSRSSRSGASEVGKGGVVRVGRRPPRGAAWRSGASRATSWALAVLGYASSGLPGPGGQPRELRLARRGRARGRRGGPRGGRAKGRAVKRAARRSRSSPAATRRRPPRRCERRDRRWRARPGSRCASRRRRSRSTASSERAGRRAGRRPRRPTRPRRGARRRRHDPHRAAPVRGREVPVFAINFGAIGFLATVERDDLDEGIRARADAATSTCSRCPALDDHGRRSASSWRVNDISFHRRPGGRVAELALLGRGRGARRGALRRAGGRPRRPARRATTSPTAARCWPGAWRASSCRSSRRTRSRRGRWWWPRTTCWRW